MALPPLILIVDDEAQFLEIFSAKLTSAGYRIQVADDGNKGIAMAKDLKPDLILMDMKMPNLTGAEALIKLQEDSDTKNIKVLFLSNLGDPQPEAQQLNDRFASQIGALGYLRKTDDLDILVDRVGAILKK